MTEDGRGGGGQAKTGAHLDDELLSRLVDGDLAPDDRRAAETHLAGCDACRARLDALGATVSLLRALPEPMPGRSFRLGAEHARRPSGWSRLSSWLSPSMPAVRAAAVALVLLVGGVAAFSTLRDDGEEPATLQRVPEETVPVAATEPSLDLEQATSTVPTGGAAVGEEAGRSAEEAQAAGTDVAPGGVFVATAPPSTVTAAPEPPPSTRPDPTAAADRSSATAPADAAAPADASLAATSTPRTDDEGAPAGDADQDDALESSDAPVSADVSEAQDEASGTETSAGADDTVAEEDGEGDPAASDELAPAESWAAEAEAAGEAAANPTLTPATGGAAADAAQAPQGDEGDDPEIAADTGAAPESPVATVPPSVTPTLPPTTEPASAAEAVGGSPAASPESSPIASPAASPELDPTRSPTPDDSAGAFDGDVGLEARPSTGWLAALGGVALIVTAGLGSLVAALRHGRR